MNQPITIKMMLDIAFAYYILIPVILAPIGIVFIMHELSGGYWPKWYFNLKKYLKVRSSKNESIILGLGDK